ncbi:MAG: triose-phosphate isomerase [Mogibacterium sp.]|nr:triose-phosphate isomerase [Mogibacterium sp.]
MKRQIRTPFFAVNIKSYLYGDEAVRLARIADHIAGEKDIDILFTAQAADIRLIKEQTENVIVVAQHMDGIKVGRGMGAVLPEALKAAGGEGVVLNHAECPLTIAELDAAIERARELELFTIVCADTPAQCRAVACFGPDAMICEPTSLIGSGNTSPDEYIAETTSAVRETDPSILIIQAAGVSTPEDVYRIIKEGSDGTGGTSGIVKAADQEWLITQMVTQIKKAFAERS